MAKTVLVINAGSSSIKYQLVDLDSSEAIASGIVEAQAGDGALRRLGRRSNRYEGGIGLHGAKGKGSRAVSSSLPTS